jgi:hypothetical protein
MEQQASLADAICKKYAGRQDFCSMSLRAMSELDLKKTSWNTTAVGNAAYMALNSHIIYREKFQQEYERLMIIVR